MIAAIAGLIGLESGRIAIDGRVVADTAADIDAPARDRRVGVVFQDYLLFRHLTVRDNVAFSARVRGAGRMPRGAQPSRTSTASG